MFDRKMDELQREFITNLVKSDDANFADWMEQAEEAMLTHGGLDNAQVIAMTMLFAHVYRMGRESGLELAISLMTQR